MLETLFTWSYEPTSADLASLLIRWAIALAMLPYGLTKLFDHSGADKFPKVLFFSSKAGFYCSMLIETLVPLCLMTGFLTRLAVIPALISFAFAMKVSWGQFHTSPAVPFFLGLIVIFVVGSGQYSLDYLLLTELIRL